MYIELRLISITTALWCVESRATVSDSYRYIAVKGAKFLSVNIHELTLLSNMTIFCCWQLHLASHTFCVKRIRKRLNSRVTLRAGGRTPRTPRSGGPHACSGASCCVGEPFWAHQNAKNLLVALQHSPRHPSWW